MEGTKQQLKSEGINTPPIKTMDPSSSCPLTPCVGPTYWSPESRQLITSDYYNIMFPNKRASICPLVDGSTGIKQLKVEVSPDVNPFPDEVDRLFDFEEKDGDEDDGGGDDGNGSYKNGIEIL